MPSLISRTGCCAFFAQQEDDKDEGAAAPTPRQAAPLPQPNKALSTSGSNSRLATIKDAGPGSSSSGSDQEPLPSDTVNATVDPAAAVQASAVAVPFGASTCVPRGDLDNDVVHG